MLLGRLAILIVLECDSYGKVMMKKIIWVSWDVDIKLRDMGDLGVDCLDFANDDGN